MATVFPEEQQLLDALLEEWYDTIKEFTSQASGIFSSKAKDYDRVIPPWQSLDFPGGMAHEIGKKIDRVRQLLSQDPVPWDKVAEELRDIHNYSGMMGGIILMFKRRGLWSSESPLPSPPSQESQLGTDQDSTTVRSPAGSAPTKKRPTAIRRGSQ